MFLCDFCDFIGQIWCYYMQFVLLQVCYDLFVFFVELFMVNYGIEKVYNVMFIYLQGRNMWFNLMEGKFGEGGEEDFDEEE